MLLYEYNVKFENINKNESHSTFTDCGALTAPGNGTVDTQTGTKYQSVALFYCNTGYDLIGVSSTKCGADGVWDSVKPRCHIKGIHLQAYFPY